MTPTPLEPLPIDGVLQHYAWGGYNFIPNLLNRGNTAHEPTAELWLGTHPKGPAAVTGEEHTLDEVIAAEPQAHLGGSLANRFAGRLPFLFKILDVREMLSVQVHPSKPKAEAGFAREEKLGIPRDAPDRSFRDDNHKPELGVALTDFYLLHGFRPTKEIAFTLDTVPGWSALSEVFDQSGISGLYAHVMSADQEEINTLLGPLIERLEANQPSDLSTPEYWARKAHHKYTDNGNYDRGIFSIYWLNIVHLRPGEGIFQDAGVPHAYLHGTCVELMANSDNVLRGGLTPKHIDVEQLLRHTSYEVVRPQVLYPQVNEDEWDEYETPVADFRLAVAERPEESRLRLDADQTPCLLFLLKGQLREAEYNLVLDRHQRAVFVPHGLQLDFRVPEETVVYRAGVNLDAARPSEDEQGHHVTDR